MASKESVSSSVYTVLILVTLLALLAGVIFVAMRSNELFDTWNPLDAKGLSMMVPNSVKSFFV